MTKGEQATAMEWQTVENRKKRKKTSTEKQPVKITPGSEAVRKAPERGF